MFLSGLFMGIFMAVTMEPSEKEAIAEHLLSFLAGDAADVSFIDYAQTAFRKNAVLWLVIFTGGFTVLGRRFRCCRCFTMAQLWGFPAL